MTIKTAAWVAVALVGAAFLFSYVYLSFSKKDDVGFSSVMVPQDQAAMRPKSVPTPAEFKAPATPDTAVDDLIDEALADRDDIDAEVKGELSNLEADTANVNSLNDVYDANEIQ